MQEQTTEQPIQEPIEELSSQPSAFEADLDDLKAENEQLRSEIRMHSAREEIVSALTAERARSPELLFEFSSGRLDFDDDGKLKNSGDLITGLKQRFPEQFASDKPAPIPSINSGAARTGSRPPPTKEMLASMKPHDIAKLDWMEVKQVLEH